jgi:hypothetical protein
MHSTRAAYMTSIDTAGQKPAPAAWPARAVGRQKARGARGLPRAYVFVLLVVLLINFAFSIAAWPVCDVSD